MQVLVVIVNYGPPELVEDCLRTAVPEVRAIGEGCRIGLCDNGSGDGVTVRLRSIIEHECWCEKVDFLPLPDNRGFAGGNNAVIELALNANHLVDYILLLNPDTLVHPGAIKALVEFMHAHPNVGICGSRLEHPDGTAQHAARRFPSVFSELESMLRLGPISRLLQRWRITEPESDQPHPTQWLPGASMMIRREVFDGIGLLDDGYFMYYEEVDFCLRAKRAGWEVWYVPESRVVHLVGQSSGVTSDRPRRRPQYWYDSRRRYFEKNHGKLWRIVADMAFVTGLVGHRLRCIVCRKPDSDPPYLLRDFVRYSLFGSLGS